MRTFLFLPTHILHEQIFSTPGFLQLAPVSQRQLSVCTCPCACVYIYSTFISILSDNSVFLPRALSLGDLSHQHLTYSQVTHYFPFLKRIPSSDSQSITIHLIIPKYKSLNCLQKFIIQDSTPKIFPLKLLPPSSEPLTFLGISVVFKNVFIRAFITLYCMV